ncbi:hypothetical protein ADUPG1_003989, partial [Aduncisulcus paluster]
MRVSEFDFEIHHVKGADNGAADCCSRLVRFSENPESLLSFRIAPDLDSDSAPLKRIKDAQALLSEDIIEKEGWVRGEDGLLR